MTSVTSTSGLVPFEVIELQVPLNATTTQGAHSTSGKSKRYHRYASLCQVCPSQKGGSLDGPDNDHSLSGIKQSDILMLLFYAYYYQRG